MSSKKTTTLKTISSTRPSPTEGDSSSPSSSFPKNVSTDALGKPQSRSGPETLRQKAMNKLSSNPSQLGDPTSLKAETSNTSPIPSESGSHPSTKTQQKINDIKSFAPAPTEGDSNSNPPFSSNLSGAGGVVGQVHGRSSKSQGKKSQDVFGKEQERGSGGHETLRQKAMKKLNENPAQLGDPVSLKAEKTGTGKENSPTEGDLEAEGGGKPKSKL